MTVSRRDFLESILAAAALSGNVPRVAAFVRQPEYDIVVRGGDVVDGSGGPPRRGDVAIVNGRFSRVDAAIVGRGRTEIDARGQIVAPGFIDIHSHGDGNLGADPRAESCIRQGITTIVVGADGSSRAHGATGGNSAGSDNANGSFRSLFQSWDSMHPGVNVASMIGLGTVRGVVVGNEDRAATSNEVARMSAMVANALAEGACGASSGLEYTPGAFASLNELIALCTPLAASGLPYATHMRNEDDRVLDAIDESIAVAKGAGCALQISHLKTQGPRNWNKLDEAFRRIEAARQAGIDVAFDRYPYLAYATGLTNLFPVWSRAGGTNAFFARLREAEVAPKIEAETRAKIVLIGGWENVLVTSVSSPSDRDATGKTIAALAGIRNLDPYALTVQLLTRSNGNVGMAGFAMSERNLERILAHPHGMVCTDGGSFAIDGPTRSGSPHPRGIGSFPRVLGRYVRERNALSLTDAIRKMTSLPASRVHLTDRGMISVGRAADLVVFDPEKISDTSTFESPFQYPVGIKAVLVNGKMALLDGLRSSVGAGRGLPVGRG